MSFKIGTINIGDRQNGRIQAESVINCLPDKKSIKKAIKKIYSKEFNKILKTVKNPYKTQKLESYEVDSIDFKPLIDYLKKREIVPHSVVKLIQNFRNSVVHFKIEQASFLEDDSWSKIQLAIYEVQLRCNLHIETPIRLNTCCFFYVNHILNSQYL